MTQPTRYLLEIAVTTPDEAVRAVAGGADRLELSSALEVGGVTPSISAFRTVKEVVPEGFPVYVLLRPRPGGFDYTEREFDVMRHDAQAFMKDGARGLVFGILNSKGIDRARCQRLVDLSRGHAVFHRAFDFFPDQVSALEELIQLGFERVLTSGQAPTAEAGTDRLATLVEEAGWQLEILPAGGIRPENVADLVRKTHCGQVHSSARAAALEHLPGSLDLRVAMGADAAGAFLATSQDVVQRLRRELDGIS